MKIGIVDLDTSHPQNWVPIERELGYDVVGVWDGGTVHPAGYAEKFAKDHDIPRVFASVEEMVPAVDCAIIHSCNWDLHVERARPFVEAGKAVLIDKPMAGNLRDLNRIKEWAQGGVRIAGGSSLRFCDEIIDWVSQPVEERGTPHTVLCGCAVDEFNYGIHAYSMLSGIMGSGAVSVRHLSKGVQRRICVDYGGGRMGILIVGAARSWMPFYTAIATEKKAFQYQAES
ncbi:MAG: Oxidoreductase, partial [Candidatus Hydrogenedentes bacterium]|nr:Oxidoreductase [Candidatus Hydrogenedentota bacterium]